MPLVPRRGILCLVTECELLRDVLKHGRGPAWLTNVAFVSGRRRGPGRRRRAGRSTGAPPFGYDESALDAEIAALEDDPDAMRVTVNVSVVVRATRERVLDRFAREVWAARRESLSPDDFAPLAYQAACEDGFDDITGGRPVNCGSSSSRVRSSRASPGRSGGRAHRDREDADRSRSSAA
jgi:hypothetical protein